MEPGSGNERRTQRREEPASPARFRGVRMKGGMWVAEVRLPRSRRKLWLGTFADAEKAARAYDAAVYCLRGPDAALNFPERRPDIPSASSLSPEEIRAAATAHAHNGPRRPVDQAGPSEAGRTEPPVELGEPLPIFSPEYTLCDELPEYPRSDDDDIGGFDSTPPIWNF